MEPMSSLFRPLRLHDKSQNVNASKNRGTGRQAVVLYLGQSAIRTLQPADTLADEVVNVALLDSRGQVQAS